MKRKTLSQAKNLMHRALRDLIDPPPTQAQQDLLRTHFDGRCAYCDSTAPRRSGHLDHASANDGNALGNLVLACSTCNGDEKRAEGWETFLRKKCGIDEAVFQIRRKKIDDWRAKHPVVKRQFTPAIKKAIHEAESAIEGFEAAYNRVRAAVRNSR